ncbi:MAG TPA: protein kinase [Pyrinomonadaceae bacterium]|nr:protein kinase [Pyrinomonadaceae bacterium]
MESERWRQIKSLLQSALERQPGERSAFLAAACADDEPLRKDVESLILSHEQAGGFIESPAFEVMAESLGDQTDSLAGQSFGPYQIIARIGIGGMGEVYLAEDSRLGRKVALKMLPTFFTKDNDRVRRFQQEARAASALNHPNILTIYEIGQIAARHFIATEFIEGETLRRRMSRTEMRINEALEVSIQVASALSAAHQAAIAHRDIKPGNIMLRPDALVKVLDFGLAKLTEPKSGESEAATLVNTKQGIVMGTAHYMSPEQTRGQRVDARTDIWSLGVVLYEMTTGRMPFEGPTASDVISLILQKEPLSPARHAPEVPPELERIITKALRKDREERYQTVKDMLLDLKSLKQRLEFEAELERSLPPGAEGRASAKSNRAAKVETVKKRKGVLSGSSRAVSGQRRARKAIASLAVLPLINASEDPNLDYLSDGITESIINNLSQVPRLRVFARSTMFRYKGQAAEPQRVGRELGARAVLMGRVLQLGDRLVVGVELVDATDETQLWGEHYNRRLADVFELQDEIAREITEKLRLKLSPADKGRLKKRHTESVEAYQAYLKGRYFWNARTEEGLRKGLEYFNQAIEQDPGYAAAYDGLSDSYALLALRGLVPAKEAFPKARAAARKALEIDDALGEAYASLAHVRLHEWDWVGLEEEFQRALKLNPGHSIAYHWYAEYLMAIGKTDESIAIVRQAQEIDPLSPIINATMAIAFYFARQYDQGIEQLRQGLELTPNHFSLHLRLGHAYLQKRKYEEAIQEMQKAVTLSGRSTETLAGLGQAYAAAGLKEELQQVLDELNQQSKERYVSPYYLAKIYASLGEREQAFTWLEKAYQERNPDFIELRVEPLLDPIRSDARFRDLLSRVGLAPSPEEGRISAGHEGGLETHLPIQRSTARAIAVLPFRPISTVGRDEYLELGMADALITKLSNIGQIVVRPTSSVRKYTDLEQDSTVAGRELKVESVLEGSIQRRDDWLRVTARLVSVEDGRTLWADKFDEDFTDIFAVQDSISEKVAAALALKLTGEEKERLTKRYTENTAAYQFYMRGLHFFNKRSAEGYKKAIEYYQQAIEIDPNYARAYTGLADCYANSSIAEISPKHAIIKARTAAMKALEIDDSLAEAHNALAHVKVNLDWDWLGAEREFNLALKLNPNYVEAHHRYSHYLVAMGRFEESLTESLRGLELDPLDLSMNTHLGWYYLMAGQNDQAIEQLKKTLELDKSFVMARHYLGQAYERKGMYQEAIAELQKVRDLYGQSQIASGLLGHAYAVAGLRGEAQKMIEELKEQSKREYVWRYYIAIIHVGLGEKDQAFEWLEKACEDRGDDLIYLKVEQTFDPLRSDPRFEGLLKKIGLEK